MKSILKSTGIKVAAALTCGLFVSLPARAGTKPAAENSRITGSYYGVLFPHDFATSAANPVNLKIGGGIMTFGLAYNTLGYYQTLAPRCVGFVRGRAQVMTVEMVSSPLGGLPGALSASDLDLLMTIETDMSSFTGNRLTDSLTVRFQAYRAEGVATFVRKQQGQYFTEPVAYVADDAVNLTCTVDMSLETTGNAAIVSTEVTSTVPGVRFEAKKLSDQLTSTYIPRVKIRR